MTVEATTKAEYLGSKASAHSDSKQTGTTIINGHRNLCLWAFPRSVGRLWHSLDWVIRGRYIRVKKHRDWLDFAASFAAVVLASEGAEHLIQQIGELGAISA